ncbi:MAG TPA: spermidine/putrescine ABC transporter substrate-binding protein [Actinomycetota bacterium]|jgi:spermidine/putrescine transport system substrate-binding protein
MASANGSHLVGRREFLRRSGMLGLAAAVGPLLAACSSGSDQPVLNFLNWQDYIAPDTLAKFRAASGITTTYQTYASNDELSRDLVQAGRPRRAGRGPGTFDLMVPSDNFVRRFVGDDLLEQLDHSKLSNLANLRPEYRNEAFDPGNRYTVPWATGTTGIGYDTTALSSPPDWDVFGDARFKGKMTVLAEIRDAFGAALFSLGKDPNTTSAADVDAAASQLIKWKGVIAGFDSATYLDRLARGELVVAHAYSSDLLEARSRNPNLAFVLPPQGALRWVDSLAIPTEAEHVDNALEFMDFYLRPGVSADVSTSVQVDTGNAKSFPLLPASLQNDPVVFPPADVLAKLAFTADLGDAEKLYTEAWKRVQAA